MPLLSHFQERERASSAMPPRHIHLNRDSEHRERDWRLTRWRRESERRRADKRLTFSPFIFCEVGKNFNFVFKCSMFHFRLRHQSHFRFCVFSVCSCLVSLSVVATGT